MDMFENAVVAHASLVQAGLSSGGSLTDNLAGIGACATVGNTNSYPASSTTAHNVTTTTGNFADLTTSGVTSIMGKSGSLSVPSLGSNMTPQNLHYNNPMSYSAAQQNHQPLNNYHHFHQATSLYNVNHTSAYLSSLGCYPDVQMSNSAYHGPNNSDSNYSSSSYQRLFNSPPNLTTPSTKMPENLGIEDSLLSAVDGSTILASSLLTSATSSSSSRLNGKRSGPNIGGKGRKEANYSPPNSTSPFLPTSTVKIKTGKF